MKMVRLGIVLLLNAMAPDLAGGAAASGATALSTTDSDSGHEVLLMSPGCSDSATGLETIFAAHQALTRYCR